jgi:hypothetical protein
VCLPKEGWALNLKERVRRWLGLDLLATEEMQYRCWTSIKDRIIAIEETQDRMAARVDRALNLSRDRAQKPIPIVDWETVQAMHLAPEYQNDPKEKH